jgi:esterase
MIPAHRLYGRGERPIVMLHGLFASKENFHSLARRLETEFSVYTLDLRNHGESPHEPVMSYPLMAGDIAEFIERENLAKPVLFGHSVGGKTAMELALSRPELIGALIVEDIAPRLYEPTVSRELDALRELPLEKIGGRRDAEEWMTGRIGNRAVALFLLKNLVSKKEGGYALRLDIEAIHGSYQKLLDFQVGDRRYDGPALFLKGGASRFIRESDQEPVRTVFPRARFETLAGASHWVHAERLAEVGRLVSDFSRLQDQ